MNENYVSLISLLLNLVFGGGFLITIVTLKSERKKADATARSAELDNVEKASDILMENIVKPLKEDLNELREETIKLRKAINKANGCTFSDSCPVLEQLQCNKRDDGEGEVIGND